MKYPKLSARVFGAVPLQYIFPEKISHGSGKGHNQEPAEKRTGKILGKTKDKRKKDSPQIG